MDIADKIRKIEALIAVAKMEPYKWDSDHLEQELYSFSLLL